LGGGDAQEKNVKRGGGTLGGLSCLLRDERAELDGKVKGVQRYSAGVSGKAEGEGTLRGGTQQKSKRIFSLAQRKN